MGKETYQVFGKIIKRAAAMNLLMFDRLSLMMDLECAYTQFDLQLSNLLNANSCDFAHDICGIQNNIKRGGQAVITDFIPRFARKC